MKKEEKKDMHLTRWRGQQAKQEECKIEKADANIKDQYCTRQYSDRMHCILYIVSYGWRGSE